MRAVIVSEYGGSPDVEDLPQPEVEAVSPDQGARKGVTAVNFQLPAPAELLHRVRRRACERLVTPRSLASRSKKRRPSSPWETAGPPDGKTVIVLEQGESE